MMQFLIAAPSSGSGKTTVACAVLAALKKRGADPVSYTHLDVYKRQLCQQPEVILLDEPTSFLDIKAKIELLTILKELAHTCLLYTSTRWLLRFLLFC